MDMKNDASATVEKEEQHAITDADSSLDESLVSPLAASTSAQARILTQEDHGQLAFQDTHAFTQQYTRGRVNEQFPAAFWAEVEKKTQAKAAARRARAQRSSEL